MAPFVRCCRALSALLLVALAFARPAAAQVNVNVFVKSPLPRSLDVWKSDPTLVRITLTNTSGQTYSNLRFSFKVTGLQRGEVVRSADGHPQQPTFSLAPGETQIFTVDDVSHPSALTYPASIAQQIVQDGLPEDTYTFCANVLAGSATVGSTGALCPTFTVAEPDPPELIAPQASAEVTPASLTFTWGFINVPGNPPPVFRLRIKPILQGQNATTAMQSNPTFFDEDVSGTSYFYLPSDPAFSTFPNAVGWVWQVQARTLDGKPYGRNQGLSPVRTFTVKATDPVVADTPPPPPPPPASGGTVCASGCTVAAPQNQTVASQPASAFVGQTILIGKFAVTVTTATGTAANMGGTGTVAVPYFKAPLKVTFESLKINTASEAIGGRAVASQTPGNVLPQEWLAFTGSNTFGAAARSYVNSVANQVAQSPEQRLVSSLAGNTPVSLPLGVDKTVGGKTFVLLVLAAEFTPTQARINAGMQVPLFVANDNLALGVRGLCLNPEGAGNEATLLLTDDLSFQLRDQPGTDNDYTLAFLAPANGQPGTQAVWGCDGFKRLDAQIAQDFPRDYFVPVTDNGAAQTGRARARFTASVTDTDDWIASGQMTSWVMVPDVPDLLLQFPTLVYDNSSTSNPAGLAFPQGFQGVSGPAWTGVYVAQANLRLPSFLRPAGSQQRLTGTATGILIGSGGGITFTAGVNNLLTMDSNPGSLDGWAFSLNQLSVSVVSSSLTKGTLSGQVRVPAGSTPLNYSATLSHAPNTSKLNYVFSIQPSANFQADLFGPATLTLKPTSKIEAGNIGAGGAFMARAELDGKLSLSGTVSGIPLSLVGVSFENFTLRSQPSPQYFTPGTWSFASPQHALGSAGGYTDDAPPGSASGFPITITSVTPTAGTTATNQPKVGFTVGVKATLPAAFEATTAVTVWGRLERDAKQNFRPAFDSATLDQLCVNGDIGALTVKPGSCLTFYHDDATFGNGFNGTVKVAFLKSVEVSTTLAFGNVSGFDYWYADALATLPLGIPLAPAPFAFYGFGGGAYYHMRQNNLPPVSAVQGGAAQRAAYVPDQNVALGLKATVVAGTYPRPDLLNADVTLGVAFTSQGGIQSISLGGPPGQYNAFAFAGLTERNKAPARAQLGISYDFPNHTFDANFTLNVNVAGGLVKANGGAGMHFHDANDWFVRVGDPAPGQRFSLTTFPFTYDAYLWAGRTANPPEMPDPPYPAPAISAANRPSFSDMNNGTAILLGASTGFHAGGKFLIFYGQADAVAGFDIALRDLGNATCDGVSGTVGMDGWYANGQIYAGIAVALGIDVDLWFTSGRYEIFSGSLGATLQGGGPNPAWAAGLLRGKYSILEGLVSGNFTYEARLGQECHPQPSNTPVESPLVAVDMISDVQPAANTQNVSIFSEPVAAFNLQVGKAFDLRDQNGKVRTFRLMTEPFVLRKGQNANGAPVAGSTTLGQDGTTAYFSREVPLDGQSWYWAKVAVVGQERKNGTWVTATNLQGQPIRQERTVTFRTGDAPTTIQPQHIAAVLPRNGARHFIRSCSQGSVRLWENYGYLLNRLPSEPAGSTYKLVARFQAAGAATFTDVPASLGYPWVTFTLPTLAPDTPYTLTLVRVPSSVTTITPLAYLANVQSQSFSLGATLVRRQRQLTSQRIRPGERPVFQSVFQTSRYASLSQKIASISTGPTRLTGSHSVAADASMTERFDWFDLNGSTSSYKGNTYTVAPTVSIEAPWENTWAVNDATPDIYAFRRSIPTRSDYLPCSLSGPDEVCWAQHPIQYLSWNGGALPEERRQANQTARTDVLFTGLKPYDSPMTLGDYEAAGQPSSGGNNGYGLFGGGWSPPGGFSGWSGGLPGNAQASLTITHQHGRWAYLDRQTMLPWLNKAEVSVNTDGEVVTTKVPWQGGQCPSGYSCGPSYYTGTVRTLDPPYNYTWITNLAYYHNVFGFTEPKGTFRIRFRASNEMCSATGTSDLNLVR